MVFVKGSKNIGYDKISLKSNILFFFWILCREISELLNFIISYSAKWSILRSFYVAISLFKKLKIPLIFALN